MFLIGFLTLIGIHFVIQNELDSNASIYESSEQPKLRFLHPGANPIKKI